jgi:hypothetical protein
MNNDLRLYYFILFYMIVIVFRSLPILTGDNPRNNDLPG